MALATLALRFLREKTVLPDLITLSDHCNNLKLINLLAIFASSVHFDNLLRANLEHYCADALSHKILKQTGSHRKLIGPQHPMIPHPTSLRRR